MDKLPLVNYNGIIKEINTGDKVPISHLQGADSIVEIPDSAFADADNPTVTEVETWVNSNLTAEELLNSTIVYVRDIILKPEEYSFPTSSRTLNITYTGGYQATLDSITINGNVYAINLPLQETSGEPLLDAGLDILTDAVVTAFATEGYTVECMLVYSSSGCKLKVWQIVYNSSTPAFTLLCTYTEDSSTTSTTSTTNTASISSAEIKYTSTQFDPFGIYKIISSKAYEVNVKERTSFYEISVKKLPTHDPLQHPYGLIANFNKINKKYISTKEGWIELNNTLQNGADLDLKIEYSDLELHTDKTKTYIKVTPKYSIDLDLDNVILYIRVVTTATTSVTLLDPSTTPYVDINGRFDKVFKNYCLGHSISSTQKYFRLNSDNSGDSFFIEYDGASVTGNPTIQFTPYIYTDEYNGSTSALLLTGNNTIITFNKDTSYTLEDINTIVKNNKLPIYTNTERDAVTLTNTSVDIGKKIWNSTIDSEQTWNGTEWITTETGGSNGCTQYEFQATDTNVNTSGIAYITNYNASGTLKLNKIDGSGTDLTNYYDNLGVGSIISIYSPETGDIIKFEITSKSISSNHYIFGVTYLTGYTSAPTLPQDMKFCVFLYIPDVGGLVTDVTATLPLTSSGGATPDIDINIDSTTMEISGSNLATKNTSAIWNASKIQGRDVFNDTPADGDVIKWVAANSRFEFLPDNTGSGSTDLTLSGSSPTITIESSTGTDVTLSEGANITLTRTGNNVEIAASGGGATNLTFSGSGPFTLESDTGTDVTITEGDSIDITRTGNDLTIAATGVVKTTTNQTISGVKTFGTSDFTQVTGGSVYIENSGSNSTDISANYVGLFNSGTGESSFTATSSKIVNRSGYTVGASDLLRKDEIETLIANSLGINLALSKKIII